MYPHTPETQSCESVSIFTSIAALFNDSDAKPSQRADKQGCGSIICFIQNLTRMSSKE